MTTVSHAIASFLLACRADGLSPRTVEAYQTRLLPLQRRHPDTPITNITTDDLRALIADLYADRSPHTVHGHVRALKRFFRWLADEGLIQRNPADRIRLPRLPQAPPKAIADDDLRRILIAAATSGSDWERRRNAAIILFLADTGCRLGGMLGLRVDDLDLGRRLARVREKGGQWRFLFLLPETARALADYLDARAAVAGDTDALWLTHDGRPLSRWGVRSILRRLARRAGVRGPVGAHAFRHRFAIHYLLAGGDLASLADLLGHRNVETTKSYYARFALDDLQRKHDEFSPAKGLTFPTSCDRM